MSDTTKICPICHNQVKWAQRFCPFCDYVFRSGRKSPSDLTAAKTDLATVRSEVNAVKRLIELNSFAVERILQYNRQRGQKTATASFPKCLAKSSRSLAGSDCVECTSSQVADTGD